MGISARRTLAAVGVAVLVAVNGVASPGEEQPPEWDPEPELLVDPTTGKVTTEPEYGGVLVYVCASGPPNTASPWYQGEGDCNLISGVLEKPVVAQWAKARDDVYLRSPFVLEDDMTGALVESWELTADLTRLVLHLREGVYWHDKEPVYGRQFTAFDLDVFLENLFSVDEGECNAGPKWCSRVRVATVSHTTNPTVTLHLEQPSFIELGELLDSRRMFVYPSELLQQREGSFGWQNLVGTGPFMLTDYVPGMRITWEKNPRYWGLDEKYPDKGYRLPYVDEVQALIIVDQADRRAAYRAGRVDFLGVDDTSVSPDADKNINGIVWDTWFNSIHAFGVNVNDPHFNTLEVRAALQMALDLETINETLFDGRANSTPHGRVGDFLTDYYTPFDEWPDEVQERYMYDPDRAEALLDAAGYPRGADGTRFKTTLHQPASLDPRYAETAVDYWRRIGIMVDFDPVELSSITAMRQSGSWDGLAWTPAAVQFFDERLATRWKGGAPFNPAVVDDPEMNGPDR